MNTQSHTAGGRRWWVAVTLLAASWVASPAFAATCSPNGYNVNPKNQNSVQEFDATNSYARTVISLGVNKTASQIASDGVVLSWTQTGGHAVTLNTTNPASPTFLAPDVTAAESSASRTLTFQLTTSCPGPGGSSSTDTGTVTIINVNRPPVAYASAAPSTAYQGDTVTLNSTAPAGSPVSSDPDGDALTYLWTKTAGPAVTLTDATSATASFVAPTAASAYSLTFELRVSDRPTGGLISTASVAVTITPNLLPPVAVLQCPLQVDEHEPVVLNGSTSIPGSGGALTYAWTQLQGSPEIIVGDETGNKVEFNAPSLVAGGFDGLLEFQLQVTDSNGLWDLATCMVEIVDVTAPVITNVPDDITVEAMSSLGEVVSYAVLAQDAAEDVEAYDLACAPPSGSLFHLAAAPTKQNTTNVYCTATDLAGNSAEADFNVTVQDTTPPVITVPGSFGVEATGPGGALASYIATKLDAVDGLGGADCEPASGGNFPLGTTPVTCNATDARLNAAAPASFNLTVHDTTGPVIDPHTDVTVEATGPAGASVSYTSPATSDIVDGVGTASCSPLSGINYPLGETTVLCNAADQAGNAAAQTSFKVFVVDTTPPVIDSHLDITAEATGPAGASVSYTSPATSDIVDGNGTATCTPASTSTFALGETTVLCNAADLAGNAADQTAFKVFVVDTTAPVVTAPADVTREATGPLTAVSFGNATAEDAVGVTWLTNDAPGLFPLGTTTITWTARDAAGNQGTATSTVTVVDTTAPALTTPADLIREATSAAGAAVGFTTSAEDLVSGSVAVTCSPVSGSTFALGSTTVACSAADAIGNTAHASFNVTVVDTTGPTIAPHADVNATASGNSSAVVNYTLPTASDLVDGPVGVTCTPVSGSTFNVGSTTVTCSATDAAGNSAVPTTFKVIVSYSFNGFFRPIDNLPTINVVKAGSAIPVKFSLGGNQGLNIFAANYPASVSTACSANQTDAVEETVTAGSSTLQYDPGADQYIYVWKTDKSWTGCRQLQVKLRDGSSRWATFSFTR